MAEIPYINTRDQSFFSNYFYDQITPEKHFLGLLNHLIGWERFTERPVWV